MTTLPRSSRTRGASVCIRAADFDNQLNSDFMLAMKSSDVQNVEMKSGPLITHWRLRCRTLESAHQTPYFQPSKLIRGRKRNHSAYLSLTIVVIFKMIFDSFFREEWLMTKCIGSKWMTSGGGPRGASGRLIIVTLFSPIEVSLTLCLVMIHT